MADVIHLPVKPKRARSRWDDNTNPLNCLGCDSTRFRITQAGYVYCGCCGAWMSNLAVKWEAPA